MGSDTAIGIFDSGVGGLSVLKALRAELPQEDFVYFADTAHAPYGERGDAHVVQRSLSVARELVEQHGIKALVVACNTATAAAVYLLREAWPSLPIVGVEPALKPAAALTRTRRVAVFATRGTLASVRFRALHDTLAGQAQFVLQPCDGLAAAVEADDAIEIGAVSAHCVRAAGRFGTEPGQIDTLVLGCTHYPFAAQALRALVGPHVQFVETGEPVARQARRLLQAAGLDGGGSGRLTLQASGPRAALESAAARWLGAG